jgi:hypothetical protein
MYKVKGKLIHKGDAKQVSEKFRVMDFVIETPDEKYPQKVQFQAANDRIQDVNMLAIGEEVELSFDLRGREYNGKYYNTLNAYKIESTLF